MLIRPFIVQGVNEHFVINLFCIPDYTCSMERLGNHVQTQALSHTHAPSTVAACRQRCLSNKTCDAFSYQKYVYIDSLIRVLTESPLKGCIANWEAAV